MRAISQGSSRLGAVCAWEGVLHRRPPVAQIARPSRAPLLVQLGLRLVLAALVFAPRVRLVGFGEISKDPRLSTLSPMRIDWFDPFYIPLVQHAGTRLGMTQLRGKRSAGQAGHH